MTRFEFFSAQRNPKLRNDQKFPAPKDAEREDDNGAGLSWLATDFERSDDVGIPSNQSKIVGCGSFSPAAYSFVDIKHGGGNVQVQP